MIMTNNITPVNEPGHAKYDSQAQVWEHDSLNLEAGIKQTTFS